MKIKTFITLTLFSIFLIIFSSYTTITTPDEIDIKIKKIKDLNYKSTLPTDKAIKIVLACYNDSKKIKYKEGIKKSGIFLTTLYLNKLDFENTIKISNDIEYLIEESEDYKNLVEFYNSRAYSYTCLSLRKDAYKEYMKALKCAKKIKDEDYKQYMTSLVYLNFASFHSQSLKSDEDSVLHYYKKALYAGEKISENGEIARRGEKKDWMVNINYFLGDFYLECKSPNINLSETYFKKARHIYETSKTKMLLGNEIAFLAYLSKFYYKSKNYKEAVYFGLNSLELQKKQNFPLPKKIAYEFIAKSYLKLNKKDDYQQYINKYIALNDSLNIIEKVKASTSLDAIITKKEEENKIKITLILYISTGIILILEIVFLLFWKHRNKKIHSNYLAIIEKLKDKKDVEDSITVLVSKEKTGTFRIPEETYDTILAKIEMFEKNHEFLNKDITLSYLSNQFKTNPKSLSFVIKSSTDKNFNTYINDLRINYITNKLYRNKKYREFKIEYLADECGFSSSKVFVNAFKKKTGVTPSYYITNLKKDLG